MQTVETQNEGLKRAYRLTISAADIEAKVDGEVRKMAPKVRMPGFRPGKVPANLVKKMHHDALVQEALNSSIQEGIDKTLADNRLRPATQPHVHLGHDYTRGKDAEVDFHFEILPDVPTPAIDGLTLERLTVAPAEAEVAEALARIADGNKRFEPAPKEQAAVTGDVVVIDFEGKVDGVPFEGGTGEAMAVEIGAGQLIPGFEEQLLGLKANDAALVKVTFPADYGAEALQGRDATFDVTVGEVRTRAESAIDDDFAKTLGLESLEQLTGLVTVQLEQELNGLSRTHMKRQLLDQLAAAHDFAVPPSMVEAEFKQIWQQLEEEAARDADPAAASAEIEKEREEYRAIAVRRVRLGLLLSEIGQANGVTISQQEMNMLIGQAAQQYRPEDRQRFAQYIGENAMAAAQLRAPLYEDKVVDYLFDKAEISERAVDRATLEAAIESEDGKAPAPAEAKPAKAARKKPAKAAPAGDEATIDATASEATASEATDSEAGASVAEAPAASPKRKAKPAAAEAASAETEAAPAKKPAAKKPAAKKMAKEG